MTKSERQPSRRDFLKLTGFGSAAALLAACGAAPATSSSGATSTAAAIGGPPAADTTATLTIFDFGGDAEKKIYGEAEARFKKRYPNVTITDNFTPVDTWSGYADKITTQIAGGQVPDIINVAIEGTRLLVKRGLLASIDELVSQDGKDLIADVAKPLIDAFTVDGKLWQVPHSWNNMVIYYNTKMFQAAKIDPPKADWTWDQFLEIAKKLTTGSGGNQVFGFAIPNFNFGLQPWFLTNGTTALTPDWTQSNLNDPKAIEAMTFVHDLVHVHKVSPAVEGTDAVNLLATGKVAMAGFGHWPIQNFIASKFLDFDVQYWPRKTTATSVYGVGGFAIGKDSKNKALAWELIKELSGTQTSQGIADAGAAIPARRSIANTPGFLKFPSNSKIYYESLNDSKPVPAPANFNEVESIFMRHWGEMMSGSVAPKDAMTAAHTELAAAMAKLKSS
ncbi:MAG: sugar ABC transporter substrate-binding protein [Herpetosiphonaceae bacterium]|nr:sugar ABC transporter substrate-binding protein [Herpetosiphonaceae bacterium]